jgi:hypothetical protein
VLQAVISDEAKRKALQDYFFHSDNYVFSKSGESSNLLFLRVRRSLRILRDTVTEAEFAAIERNRLDFREALVYGEQTRSAENGT